MGKHVEFKLNRSGVRELLKSAEMRAIVGQQASAKAAAAGEGYASEVHTGRNRVYANIYPDTDEAREDNWDHNTLEKVIRS